MNKKTRGGHREGSGRKKNAVKAAVLEAGIDGRSVGGKEHAAWLIEQLNAIDPQLIEDLDRYVRAEPFTCDEHADDETRKNTEELEARRREHWTLKKAAQRAWRKLTREVQGWARIWFGPQGFECRRYLYDKAGHKAVQIINHVHDKPIDVNLNVSIAAIVRGVRERKQAYERSRTA